MASIKEIHDESAPVSGGEPDLDLDRMIKEASALHFGKGGPSAKL